MSFPEPYRLADRAILNLNRVTVRLFDRAKRRAGQLKFDELNVYRTVTELYDDLMETDRRQFLSLWAARYREVLGALNGTDAVRENPSTALWRSPSPASMGGLADTSLTEDSVDEMAELYITELLSKPNPLTKYAWETEALRKRDRAIEGILSADGRGNKNLEFDRAMRYWSQQTGFYIDIVSDEAALQAMKDGGVKKVRWITSGDERVCENCKDLNGTVFDIDHVPDKPHVRCRCWLVPA